MLTEEENGWWRRWTAAWTKWGRWWERRWTAEGTWQGRWWTLTKTCWHIFCFKVSMPGSFTGQWDIIDRVINIVGYISLAVIQLCVSSYSKWSGLDKILWELKIYNLEKYIDNSRVNLQFVCWDGESRSGHCNWQLLMQIRSGEWRWGWLDRWTPPLSQWWQARWGRHGWQRRGRWSQREHQNRRMTGPAISQSDHRRLKFTFVKSKRELKILLFKRLYLWKKTHGSRA